MADAFDRLALVFGGSPDDPGTPSGWEGNQTLGIAGVTAAPREVLWDAAVTLAAPGLEGDQHRFAVARDGSVLSGDGTAVDHLEPLVAALTAEIDPPFCAVTVRDVGDIWAAAASRGEIVELPDARAEEIEVARVGGVVTTRVDGEDSTDRFAPLEELAERAGSDAAVIAHRFLATTWVAEVFPL